MKSGLVRTEAVLLRRVDYRDADLLLTLFTRDLGKITLLARGARRSKKRFAGALEPMHGLSLEISGTDPRYVLEGATIGQLRPRLTASLARMDAAARALSWVRDTVPEGAPDAAVWQTLEGLLTALDAVELQRIDSTLAAAGLQLLSALGWALELEHCVVCGRPCPPAKAAMIDPVRGGLVCGECGGARLVISGPQRGQLNALLLDVHAEVDPSLAELAQRIIDTALAAHADVQRR
jgi:DNA repair protein RecO (recombination protein O)